VVSHFFPAISKENNPLTTRMSRFIYLDMLTLRKGYRKVGSFLLSKKDGFISGIDKRKPFL